MSPSKKTKSPGLLSLSLLVPLLLLASPLSGATKAADLLSDLKAALAGPAEAGAPGTPVSPQINQYLSALGSALARGRYAECDQLISVLRTSGLASNAKVAACLDQLSAEIAVTSTAADAARDKALEEIIADAGAKFTAKAKASDFDPLLKRLASLPSPGGGQYNDPGAQKLELVRSFVTRAQDYMQQSATGNAEQAANILNELVQLTGRIPSVSRSQLLALQSEAAARLGARNEAATARFESLKKTVQGLIETAKTAADFDEILAEMAKPVVTNYNYSNNNLGNQIENLRRFTRRWQDYYGQLEAGNGQAAQTTLREIAGDNNSEAFYPRSRILARLNGKPVLPTSADAVGELVPPDALTLDTIDKLARQLAARPGPGAYGAPEPGKEDLATEVNRFRSAANQLRLGNFQSAYTQARPGSSAPHTGEYSLALARMQQALILQILPGYISAPAELKPTAKEAPDAYLMRVLAHAREKADWSLAYRAIDAMGWLNPNSAGITALDFSGYRSFFTGLNQEKAGQWVWATRYYLGALKSTGQAFPAEEIGRRLQEIKAAHPAEYESGEKQSETSYLEMGRNGAMTPGIIPPGYMMIRNPNNVPPLVGSRNPPPENVPTPVAPEPAARKETPEPEKTPAAPAAEPKK